VVDGRDVFSQRMIAVGPTLVQDEAPRVRVIHRGDPQQVFHLPLIPLGGGQRTRYGGILVLKVDSGAHAHELVVGGQ
jgi:hypothetical protein